MAVKPKLALIPSGYKGGSPKGTLYSVLPSDGTGDFDFSRSGSATRVNKDGLIETVSSNVPRLNYPLIDGVVSGCPSLLLEPASINLIPYSEDFTQGAWVKTNVSISSNVVVSPDGTLNADEVNITTANAYFLFNTISVSELTDYTFTFYAKKGTATDVSYSILNAVNFTNIVNTTSYFNEISDTDWTKIIIEFTTPLGCNSIRVYPLRDGSSTGTVYIFGTQLEQGSYPTSYIPTQGSIGTRVTESCEKTVPDGIIGQTEGTVFFKADVTNSFGVQLGNSSGGGDFINSIQIAFGLVSTNVNVFNGGTGQFSYSGVVNTGVKKVALTYKQNDFAFYIDGNQIATGNSGTIPSVSGIFFNHQNLGTTGGFVTDLKIYNTRLSNTELQALTKI